jgi:hypothetical protein
MNKLLPLGLKFSKKMVTTRTKALRNLIGDILWLLEAEIIKKVLLTKRKYTTIGMLLKENIGVLKEAPFVFLFYI